MEPHQERVIIERDELEAKIGKLELFFYSHTFALLPIEERMRLGKQLSHMRDYRDALVDRIAAF